MKLFAKVGADLGHTVSIQRLDIPAIKVSDGPMGARGADESDAPTFFLAEVRWAQD
jgi:hypothetical protein